jgi:ribonuclease HII
MSHSLLGHHCAGFDEAGRGCLAGPVIAAAVILPADVSRLQGLTDSKKLTPNKRATLARLIQDQAVCWAVGRSDPGEIDRINILRASLLAMRRAHDAMAIVPSLGLVDGKHAPDLPCPTRTIVGGDLSEPAISAASILAKVYRDQEMRIADILFPGYGFAIYKGYPTRDHREALSRLGPSPLHRRSFGPIQRLAGGPLPDPAS